MNIFQGIIDIYDGNTEIDLEDAWKRGVRAILHETSRGLYKKKDRAYLERKKAALDMGFLWAGYHLVSSEDVNEQLKVFLAMEDGSDPRIGMAIDWEKTSKGIASGDQIRELVERFNTTMKPRYPDRYPILYGGNLIREDEGIQKGDALLAKCPLWYAFLNANPLTNKKYPFPRKTWSTYTLWQFDDEKRQHGAPPPNVLPGADWNRFQGTEDDLRNAWPFGGLTAGGVLPVHPLTNEVITAAAPPVPGFAGRAAAIALQEWDFWGKQTYDLNGHATLVGHKEMQPGWYERVGIYWDQGVRIHGVDGRNRDWAWSAAFISWVMRTAGAGDRFRYSKQHSVYVAQAIRDYQTQNQAAGYWGVLLSEEKPNVGDIICWSRQTGISYENTNGGDYAGHCDLIISVADNEIEIVGGNVGDSVTRRPLALKNGFVQPATESGEYLFALLKNRIS